MADPTRKILDEGAKFYDLSLVDPTSDEAIVALGKCIAYIVLGKSGSQRSRFMSIICKDSRLNLLEAKPAYLQLPIIIQKLHTTKLIRVEDLKSLEDILPVQYKTVISDGISLIQKTCVEHNISVISKIYCSISFTELSSILGVAVELTEKIVARMITEERISGSIDQPVGYLFFNHGKDGVISDARDESIHSLCHEVSLVLEAIDGYNPAFMS